MSNSTSLPNLLTDPGFLFWAPLGTAEPTNTVAASVFTDAWPVAWVNLGATDNGSQFDYETKVAPVKAAEFFDPVKYKVTDRDGQIGFSLVDLTLANLKKVLNGGTLTVVSGTTTTQLNKLTPPTPGAEVRSMIGWESLDATVRLIAYQCLQGGKMSLAFKPGANRTAVPASFMLEVPSTGIPWAIYSAGTARA